MCEGPGAGGRSRWAQPGGHTSLCVSRLGQAGAPDPYNFQAGLGRKWLEAPPRVHSPPPSSEQASHFWAQWAPAERLQQVTAAGLVGQRHIPLLWGKGEPSSSFAPSCWPELQQPPWTIEGKPVLRTGEQKERSPGPDEVQSPRRQTRSIPSSLCLHAAPSIRRLETLSSPLGSGQGLCKF